MIPEVGAWAGFHANDTADEFHPCRLSAPGERSVIVKASAASKNPASDNVGDPSTTTKVVDYSIITNESDCVAANGAWSSTYESCSKP